MNAEHVGNLGAVRAPAGAAVAAGGDEPAGWLPVERLQTLLDALRQRGYTIIGPTIDQGAVVGAPIEQVDELPRGWTDEQQPGKYRLVPDPAAAYFGYVLGPQALKRWLFPPKLTVARADRTLDGWQMSAPDDEPPRYAFLGVRACDLAAVSVQDRVFLREPYVDPVYAARRERALIVAVNCTRAASTCFCTSQGTGPRCGAGFDLALTELPEGFTVEVGTQRGAEIAGALGLERATDAACDAAETARRRAVEQITRRLDNDGIRDLLLENLEHPRWDDVAARCLSCTNCTMVCPTCFCCSVTEVADLTGQHVERERTWDSCFNPDFSYLSGGPIRNQIRTRYRQWLTHKLASWHDQFGVSGCVGCGRCITWCPVGIDLTAEVAALREGSE